MSYQSAELKLRTLAQQNASLAAALTFNNVAGNPTFMWFDRQLAQGDIGKPSDNRTCVLVQRVSTAPRVVFGNQGGVVQPLSQPRFQLTIVDYNAERARQVAQLVSQFMMTVSLLDPGEFGSPQTSPTQAPNFLLNERGGMYFQIQNPTPPYTESQDWRLWNNEAVPA